LTRAIKLARTPKTKPSAAARPSAAEKGVRGSPPTTAFQLARAPKKAKPSAAARPSEAEKGVRGLLGLRHNTARPHAEESRAQRPGRAQQGRGVPESPPRLWQPNSRARQRRPSRAQRKRGVRGSPLTATLQLAHAPKKPSAAATPSAA
jgi:hypothetical protein